MSSPETSADVFVNHLSSPHMVTLEFISTTPNSNKDDTESTSSSAFAATPTTSACPTPIPSSPVEDTFSILIHAPLLASLTPLVSGNTPETIVFTSDENISIPGLKALAEFAYRGLYNSVSLLQDMQVWATAACLRVGALQSLARKRIHTLQDATAEVVRDVVQYAFLELGARPSESGGDDDMFEWLAGIAAWRLNELKTLDGSWLDRMVQGSPVFARMLLKYVLPAARPPGSAVAADRNRQVGKEVHHTRGADTGSLEVDIQVSSIIQSGEKSTPNRVQQLPLFRPQHLCLHVPSASVVSERRRGSMPTGETRMVPTRKRREAVNYRIAEPRWLILYSLGALVGINLLFNCVL